MIAMAGMFFSGDKTFMSFAIGTMMVVAVAMIGSLTVLPAMLSWLGDRVDKVRIPFVSRLKRDDGQGRMWGAILGAVLRRPLVSAIAATAVLVALALPAINLHTSQSGLEAMPKSLKEVQDYNKVQDAFPGGATPAIVAIKGDASDPALQAAVRDLKTKALASGQGARPDLLGDVAERQGRSGSRSRSSGAARTRRRTTRSTRSAARSCRPRSARSPGVEYAVTGDTAASKDWSARR